MSCDLELLELRDIELLFSDQPSDGENLTAWEADDVNSSDDILS